MAVQSLELLRGTLDLLILRALTRGRLHGFAVMRFLEEATGDALQIEEGSLYPALYRLEDRGWIQSEMGLSENNRRARFYRLTPKGRAQLKTEVADFRRFVTAVFQVIEGPAAS
jgi:PadR family transcriptional regulator PadR